MDDWIIKRAVVGYPNNPEGFLIQVITKIEEIKSNPEFQDMEYWIIARAVVHHPNNPEGFLTQVRAKIKEIKNNPEFQDMDEGIIKYAVVHYPPTPKKPNNPEEFLRGVKERLIILEQLYPQQLYPQLNLSLRKELATRFPNTFLEKARDLIEGKLKEGEEFNTT